LKNTQPEPDRKDRREDHPRHRVQRLDVGIENRRGQRRQREPQAQCQAEHGADAEREHRLDQRDRQMAVDVAGDREPVPDAREDLQRLAEEERGLSVVVEQQRRNQARRGQQVPDTEHRQQHAGLPPAQVAWIGAEPRPHRSARG
jgi:beta-phosphoglucomutase-like phosphatase (HAD superfamily)